MKIFHLFGSLMINPVIVDTVAYMLNLLFFPVGQKIVVVLRSGFSS